jgi:hypothetical protein
LAEGNPTLDPAARRRDLAAPGDCCGLLADALLCKYLELNGERLL